MEFLKFLLCLILGFLLSGIWFGLFFAITLLLQKIKLKYLSCFSSLLASILPIILIVMTLGIYPIQTNGLKDFKVYIIAIFTVILTAYFINLKKLKSKRGKDLLLWGFDGLLMEIPQRLMMQSFIYGILKLFAVQSLNLYTILATALIWCLSLVTQNIISRKQFDKDLLIDIFSSFAFSIGIGYIYQKTGLIFITMLAHFCERILSLFIANKKNKNSVDIS